MSAPRLEELKEIFHAARELPPNERDAFLDEACGTDEQLRRETAALLQSHDEADNFIADPPGRLAAEVFGKAEDLSDVGQTVGRYKLIERIGSGGMGAVYLAQRADQQFEMRVAVKLIKRGMDTESVLRRFHDERQILASLEHPNIARLLDGGTTDDGLPYFVMEYIHGERIDRYADEHRLSVKERLEIFRQVCGAVSYAHQHLVVHRDLKPSNILVTPEGVPKLLDFGIARIIQADDGAETLATLTAMPMMTPEYASPEQVEGAQATTLSDVYSLGAVLYALLSGRPPYRFKSRSREEISAAVSTAEVEKPSAAITRLEEVNGSIGASARSPEQISEAREGTVEKLQRRLRGDLDNIVLMAMRKETARRYRSVEQFSEDIRRHLAGRPVIARPDTFGYRAAKFARRNRIALAAATLLLLTLVGGVVATAWQARRATIQEQRARTEQARAERRFNDVRKLANSVLFEYHDAIKDLAGSTPVRARLVRDALEYLDRLASEVQGDTSLQRELASAYERVGDVQGGTLFANLGNTAGAIESYRKALGLRETLLRTAPHDAATRQDVALNYRKLGLLVWETGDVAGGLENNRKALGLLESLAAEQPENVDLRIEVERSCDYVGMILQEQGDVPGALEHYRRAQQIIASFPEADRSSERIRRHLAISYEHTGTALLLMGDLDGALEQNRKALTTRAALCAEFPLNADSRRTLAVSYYNDGEILGKMGRDQEALKSYRNNLRIAEELSAADPQNNQYNDDRAYAVIRVGDMLARLGDFPQALASYRQCLDLRAADMQADPTNLWKRAALIEAHAKTAKTLARSGEREAALAKLNEARRLMENTSVEPTNALIRSAFADTYVDLGEAASTLASANEGAASERRTACDLYRRSLEILEDMRNRGILSTGDAGKPAAVAQQMAQCDPVPQG